MAAGNWVDWNTGDLVTAAAFQDIQDSIVFIYADETAANAALTNKVEGTVFYDTTNNLLKAWDGSQWISAETGDISAVTAGDGLSGGGSSGDVTLDLDLNELTAASVDVANDSIAIVDATDNSSKKESIADLATAMADGSTITASAGVLSAATGGITVADQYHLTADQASNAVITSWTQTTFTGTGTIGSSMSHSSGVFTFPSTGIYMVTLKAYVETSDASTRTVIEVTTNNSTYNVIDEQGWQTSNSVNTYQVCTSSIFVDVTDTANVKVRFRLFGSDGTNDKVHGSASFNQTSATFMKIGDT